MARRGFFAEIQHQARVAERERQQKGRAAVKAHAAAARQAEQARRADEMARAKVARATAADRKQMEKEANAAHIAAKQAEVEERNSRLAEIYDEIDNLLAATLDVDDFVDLEDLRRTVQHPPFDHSDLETPIPKPTPNPKPPEPVYAQPEPPNGLFGKKKKHARAIAEAEIAHARAHEVWQQRLKVISRDMEAAEKEHVEAEKSRIATLDQERARYRAECAARETEVAEHNARIDTLMANLGYGTVEAVQEYVSIVLSNSVYPVHFPVDHDFTFDPTAAELSMRVLVPPPSMISDVKSFKYSKSTDEITSTSLSQKACKDRYSGAVQQVALRSLHEVFEADRRGLIKTISLEVGTETTDPATGKAGYMPFVAVAAEREVFIEFDLSAVVPAATLGHLGAALSKDPFSLVVADATGIRRS